MFLYFTRLSSQAFSVGSFVVDSSVGRDTEFGLYVEDDDNHQIDSVTFTDSDSKEYGPYTKMSSSYDVVNFKTINFNVGEEPPFDEAGIKNIILERLDTRSWFWFDLLRWILFLWTNLNRGVLLRRDWKNNRVCCALCSLKGGCHFSRIVNMIFCFKGCHLELWPISINKFISINKHETSLFFTNEKAYQFPSVNSISLSVNFFYQLQFFFSTCRSISAASPGSTGSTGTATRPETMWPWSGPNRATWRPTGCCLSRSGPTRRARTTRPTGGWWLCTLRWASWPELGTFGIF